MALEDNAIRPAPGRESPLPGTAGPSFASSQSRRRPPERGGGGSAAERRIPPSLCDQGSSNDPAQGSPRILEAVLRSPGLRLTGIWRDMESSDSDFTPPEISDAVGGAMKSLPECRCQPGTRLTACNPSSPPPLYVSVDVRQGDRSARGQLDQYGPLPRHHLRLAIVTRIHQQPPAVRTPDQAKGYRNARGRHQPSFRAIQAGDEQDRK